MKKQIIRLALAAIIIAAPATASAQVSLDNIASKLKSKSTTSTESTTSSSSKSSSSSSTSKTSSSSSSLLSKLNGSDDDDSSSSSSSSLLSSISSIFSSSNTATTKKIVGTWEYTEPAIVFESESVLSSAASKVAANKIESSLQTQLEKYGITEGALSMTFSSDGSFSATVNSKTVSGTWEISDSQLTISSSGSKSVSVDTQISGSTLQLVTDADGLLSLTKSITSSSSNSTMSTISSLMDNIDGMQIGLSFEKQ